MVLQVLEKQSPSRLLDRLSDVKYLSLTVMKVSILNQWEESLSDS